MHYLEYGAAEKRDPSPLFDTSYYLEHNRDVASSGMNPLEHYLRHGSAEGRRPRGDPVGPTPTAGPGPGDRPAPQGPPSDLLVVDHRMPTPDQDSGSVRMLAILKLLRRMGHAIAFVSDSDERMPGYEEALRRMGVDVHYGFASAQALLARDGPRFRFALLSRPDIAFRYLPAVRAYAPEAVAIYDTVDLHHVRLQRAAEVANDAAARAQADHFRRMERVNASCADVVLAITREEMEALRQEAPEARIEVVPNIHTVTASSHPWDRRRDLMFIGGFEHVPNLDAVKWFAEEIMPLVLRRLPGIALHVVGSKPPDALKRLATPAVRIAGYVPDSGPYFESCRVFVSPLRYGAGMKGKIGHSMSCGLPVVTTSVGAEGMLLVDGENALIANGPEDFSRAVVRLYTDRALWNHIAERSLAHVRERFSEEAVLPRLESIFPPLARPGAAARAGEGA
jgi:glycosyltransferase involved in cell wall biosynthesis